MQPIVLRLDLFASEEDHLRSQRALLWLLEALCRIDRELLQQRPYPPLYDAGVRYIREDGSEEWLDVPHVLAAGGGDCEDLACWRVAEIREAGGTARPYVRYRLIEGRFHYHVLVQHYQRRTRRTADDRVVSRLVPTKKEDPSRRLGMGPRTAPKPLKRAPGQLARREERAA